MKTIQDAIDALIANEFRIKHLAKAVNDSTKYYAGVGEKITTEIEISEQDEAELYELESTGRPKCILELMQAYCAAEIETEEFLAIKA